MVPYSYGVIKNIQEVTSKKKCLEESIRIVYD